MAHSERHSSHRTGLLRASVLGANDGIISTACLVLGVAAAGASRNAILTAGMAGLVAGSVSIIGVDWMCHSPTLDIAGFVSVMGLCVKAILIPK